MQSDKKIKTLTDTAELIEDAVRSIFVPNELFVQDFLKQSIDFFITANQCDFLIVSQFLHGQVNAATMEQSSEMLNSILKWNHSNKIRKLTNKNKVRQLQEAEACESKKKKNNFLFQQNQDIFQLFKEDCRKGS